MISNVVLTKDFWVETISMLCYIINRARSATLDFKILEKVLSGIPTNYSDLKLFERPTYMHVNDETLDT